MFKKLDNGQFEISEGDITTLVAYSYHDLLVGLKWVMAKGYEINEDSNNTMSFAGQYHVVLTPPKGVVATDFIFTPEESTKPNLVEDSTAATNKIDGVENFKLETTVVGTDDEEDNETSEVVEEETKETEEDEDEIKIDLDELRALENNAVNRNTVSTIANAAGIELDRNKLRTVKKLVDEVERQLNERS